MILSRWGYNLMIIWTLGKCTHTQVYFFRPFMELREAQGPWLRACVDLLWVVL